MLCWWPWKGEGWGGWGYGEEQGWVGGDGYGEGGQLWPVRGEWWKLGEQRDEERMA